MSVCVAFDAWIRALSHTNHKKYFCAITNERPLFRTFFIYLKSIWKKMTTTEGKKYHVRLMSVFRCCFFSLFIHSQLYSSYLSLSLSICILPVFNFIWESFANAFCMTKSLLTLFFLNTNQTVQYKIYYTHQWFILLNQEKKKKMVKPEEKKTNKLTNNNWNYNKDEEKIRLKRQTMIHFVKRQ